MPRSAIEAMAIFTTTDRDNVKAAIVTAAVAGFATVSVQGQQVIRMPLADLLRLLEVIQNDLAGCQTLGGLRIRQGVPGGCG